MPILSLDTESIIYFCYVQIINSLEKYICFHPLGFAITKMAKIIEICIVISSHLLRREIIKVLKYSSLLSGQSLDVQRKLNTTKLSHSREDIHLIKLLFHCLEYIAIGSLQQLDGLIRVGLMYYIAIYIIIGLLFLVYVGNETRFTLF